MTIQEALTQAKQQISTSSTPALDAEVLLSFVLKVDRAQLITRSEEKLSEEQQSTFEDLISKRANGTPIAYLTNEKEFYGRSFFVDERVLIPRPETEEMVEDALKYLDDHPEVKTVIDLGCGSGAIAITVALERPNLQVFGLEISPEALEVAKQNQQTHACPNLQLLESDLLSALPSTINSSSPSAGLRAEGDQPLTILANLPYIGTETNHFVSEETEAHEPHVALFGGADGLELYRRTWQQIKDQQLKLSALFMEIGFSQAEQIEKEAGEAFPEMKFEIKNDLAGLARTAVLKQ